MHPHSDIIHRIIIHIQPQSNPLNIKLHHDDINNRINKNAGLRLSIHWLELDTLWIFYVLVWLDTKLIKIPLPQWIYRDYLCKCEPYIWEPKSVYYMGQHTTSICRYGVGFTNLLHRMQVQSHLIHKASQITYKIHPTLHTFNRNGKNYLL